MDKNLVFYLMVLLPLTFFACSNGEPEEGKTLAKINDYDLSYGEFQRQLARELNFDEDLKLTRKVREEFLEQLIEEELFIQEAKRLKLDRKGKFVRAIERYWKSTLVRDLIERKGEEISQTVLIPQAEIEAYYDRMKKEGEIVLPLSKLQDKITKELKEKKKTEMLKKWAEDLEKKADIEINQKLLLKN